MTRRAPCTCPPVAPVPRVARTHRAVVKLSRAAGEKKSSIWVASPARAAHRAVAVEAGIAPAARVVRGRAALREHGLRTLGAVGARQAARRRRKGPRGAADAADGPDAGRKGA